MPSLHKLSVHSNGLQARNSRDLTVVSVPGESQLELQSTESLMEHGDIFSNLHLLIGKENGKTDALSSSPPPRKRQRLDHLSQEEKIMRRKLKNRVAAQSARDRKKARMNELEEQVVQLETQRKYLLIENAELKSRNAKLEAQNTELKLRLGLVSSDLSEKKNSTNTSSGPVTEMVTEEEEGKSEKGRSLEYAEGTGSAASYSLDDAIRILASDSETDDLLDVLQQCSDQLLQCDLTATQLEGCQSEMVEPTSDEMVGSSSKGMESIKELIQFDHIYYKRTEADSLDALPEDVVLPSSPGECETPEFHSKASIPTTVSGSATTTKGNIASPPDVQIILTTDSGEQVSDTVAYIPEVSALPDSVPSTKSSYKSLSSPASSDAGYDSSFSAMSPSSDAYSTGASAVSDDDAWDNSFTELFPSLV